MPRPSCPTAFRSRYPPADEAGKLSQREAERQVRASQEAIARIEAAVRGSRETVEAATRASQEAMGRAEEAERASREAVRARE